MSIDSQLSNPEEIPATLVPTQNVTQFRLFLFIRRKAFLQSHISLFYLQPNTIILHNLFDRNEELYGKTRYNQIIKTFNIMKGVGIDMIEVTRVANKIGKESGFREMVFSKNEIDYCEPKANKAEHYAARFAAKEAFLKAIGTGWKNGTAFHEIEVQHDEEGSPELHLLGETAKTLAPMGIQKIHLSLSHLKQIASAIVVVE